MLGGAIAVLRGVKRDQGITTGGKRALNSFCFVLAGRRRGPRHAVDDPKHLHAEEGGGQPVRGPCSPHQVLCIPLVISVRRALCQSTPRVELGHPIAVAGTR